MATDYESRRDLSELNPETHDIAACWRKVSAGAEMKTAIKRFLDDWEELLGEGKSVWPPKPIRSRVKQLAKAMEAWANAG